MDPTTVRIILIIVGTLLILGLYLWERSRDPEDDSEDFDYDDDDTPYAAGVQESRGHAFRDFAEEPAAEPPRPSAPAVREAPRATGREHHPPAPAVDDDGVPAPLLVQLSVAKRYGEFPGADLLEVAESSGLRPGDMDIFHCLDEFEDGTRVYFSMANMVKPGTFPFDDMEGFSTPGVMLFAQLDGKPEDLTILEEMIATARKLATTLGGDVYDDSRRPLTVRKEEEMRNAVLANEARFMRAARR